MVWQVRGARCGVAPPRMRARRTSTMRFGGVCFSSKFSISRARQPCEHVRHSELSAPRLPMANTPRTHQRVASIQHLDDHVRGLYNLPQVLIERAVGLHGVGRALESVIGAL